MGGVWSLYDELIAPIPEDIRVLDFCIGTDWSYVEAECGMGISHTVTGGATRKDKASPLDMSLSELAGYVRSWNFTDASLGVAAINAWYGTPGGITSLGGVVDDGGDGRGDASNPFHSLEESYAGKRVAVVGHFPDVNAMFRKAEVTVLERTCRSPLDTPDSACEYILPSQDFVLMTGTTLTNKTAPRLLELSKQARTYMVGPSAVPAPALLDAGVDGLAGSIVLDPESAKYAIKGGSRDQWRTGIRKFLIRDESRSQTARPV